MIAAGRTISVGSALRTLLYLDAHILLNRIRTVARNPLRLVLWLAFVALIVSGIQGRMMLNEAIKARPVPRSGVSPLLLDPTAVLHLAGTFVPGVILVAYGLFTIAACRQPLSVFRSAADARFLSGSALPPRLVVLWLVVRVILSLSWRLPLMLILFVFFLPTTLGVPVSTGLIGFTALLLLTATVTLNIPIFVSRQRGARPSPALVGWLLVVVGLASVAAVFIALSPGPPILPSALGSVAVSLPPGSWLVGAFEGHGAALLGLAAIAAGSLILTWLVAGDVYPELWAASARVIVLRRARRRGGLFMTPGDRRRLLRDAGIAQREPRGRQAAITSSRGRWVPPGAGTILWKEWIATRRGARGTLVPGIALLVAIVLGAGFGILAESGSPWGGFLLGPLTYLVVFGSFFTAVRMSSDLRKPIWWQSASTLRARLGVLLVARSLRIAIPVGVGLLTASLVGHSLAFVAVGVPVAAAATWAINAMGLATYAILPGSTDMRGPGGCLRGVALLIMLIPITIAAIIGAIASSSGAGSLVAAVLTALGEGWLLVLFAASKLDGNGLAFAQAERR